MNPGKPNMSGGSSGEDDSDDDEDHKATHDEPKFYDVGQHEEKWKEYLSTEFHLILYSLIRIHRNIYIYIGAWEKVRVSIRNLLSFWKYFFILLHKFWGV
jgi:hypothetical protein